MKFTWSWLQDHLETQHDLATICEALVMLGLEVEGVDDPASRLGAFRVAEILSARPHPQADRLQLCEVDDGSQTLQIVCGAPNARAGLKTVLAPVGTYVPGADITIKQGKIRGELSNGMLCSEAELGLSDEADGIIELDSGLKPGAGFVEASGLADPVIEIAITPNRGDCLGVRGIARDLAAAGYGELKELNLAAEPGDFDSPVSWQIAENATDLVPRVSGRLFEGVTNGASPDWMARRLTAVGQRPISALVDITNFVMLDLGRPLHAYDADKIAGDQLIIRRAEAGEELTALNEKTYQLGTDMLVIGDAEGADDIAGVMGGARTGVSETTSRMFLEMAVFDPISVASTGRQLNLHSDARYRFERGLDGSSPDSLAGYVARLVQQICGGKMSRLVTAGPGVAWQRQISFEPARTAALTGISVSPDEQAGILQRLGFEIDRKKADSWQVSPPAWRNDIDGAADLVEEVVRIHGFDKLPMTALPRDFVVARPAYSGSQMRAVQLRRVLAGRGLAEAVTFSFLKTRDAALFGGGAEALQLANPISADLDCMRPSILPNLLAAAARNQNRGEANIQLFEVGPVFTGTRPEDQQTACAGILQGMIAEADWQQPARPVDLFDGKAALLACLEQLGLPAERLQITTDAEDYWHPGQSGVLRLGKQAVASFGSLHPAICQAYDLKGPVAGFEFWLDTVPEPRAKGPARPLLALSALQAVSRDFAFVLDREVAAEAVLRAIRGADKTHITSVQVFDLFEGEKLGSGKKSLAVKVWLQPEKTSFDEAALAEISRKIVAAIGKHCGGTLRNG